MFEEMDINLKTGATIIICAALIIIVAGFCNGATTVNPADLNVARFGGF